MSVDKEKQKISQLFLGISVTPINLCMGFILKYFDIFNISDNISCLGENYEI